MYGAPWEKVALIERMGIRQSRNQHQILGCHDVRKGSPELITENQISMSASRRRELCWQAISSPPLAGPDFKSEDRRYHPCLPDRKPGGGSEIGKADFCGPWGFERGLPEVVSCPYLGEPALI